MSCCRAIYRSNRLSIPMSMPTFTKQSSNAAGQVGDAPFIRRATLDLGGRVPTLEETQTFVASTKPDKRVELVERLMSFSRLRAPSGHRIRHHADERHARQRASVSADSPGREPLAGTAFTGI